MTDLSTQDEQAKADEEYEKGKVQALARKIQFRKALGEARKKQEGYEPPPDIGFLEGMSRYGDTGTAKGVAGQVGYLQTFDEVADLKAVIDAGDASLRGEATPEQEQLLADAAAWREREWSVEGRVGAMLSDSFVLMQEILTGGAVGKKVAKTAATKALKKEAFDKLSEVLAKRAKSSLIAGGFGGAGVALTGEGIGLLGEMISGEEGGRVKANAYSLMLNRMGMGVSLDEAGQLEAFFTESSPDFAEVLPQAWALTLIEPMSEMSGSALMKYTGLDRLKLAQTSIMTQWLKKNPGATPGAFMRTIEAAGWHGFLGEWMEERYGGVLRAGAGYAGIEGFDDLVSEVFPGMEEMGIEALGLLTMQGAVTGVQGVLSERVKPKPGGVHVFRSSYQAGQEATGQEERLHLESVLAEHPDAEPGDMVTVQGETKTLAEWQAELAKTAAEEVTVSDVQDVAPEGAVEPDIEAPSETEGVSPQAEPTMAEKAIERAKLEAEEAAERFKVPEIDRDLDYLARIEGGDRTKYRVPETSPPGFDATQYLLDDTTQEKLKLVPVEGMQSEGVFLRPGVVYVSATSNIPHIAAIHEGSHAFVRESGGTEEGDWREMFLYMRREDPWGVRQARREHRRDWLAGENARRKKKRLPALEGAEAKSAYRKAHPKGVRAEENFATYAGTLTAYLQLYQSEQGRRHLMRIRRRSPGLYGKIQEWIRGLWEKYGRGQSIEQYAKEQGIELPKHKDQRQAIIHALMLRAAMRRRTETLSEAAERAKREEAQKPKEEKKPREKAAEEAQRGADDMGRERFMPKRVAEEAESRWPGVTVEMSERRGQDGPYWSLDSIVVPEGERKKGVGTEVMEHLAAQADEAGVVMALSPSKDFGATSVERLRRFYRRFGFKPNRGRSADLSVTGAMIRQPVSPRFMPAPLKRTTSKRTPSRDTYEFEVGENKYEVTMSRFGDGATLNFTRGGSTDILGGESSPAKVFASVVEAMRQHVQREGVTRFTFTAAWDEPTRVGLYDKFMERAERMGMPTERMELEGDGIVYAITMADPRFMDAWHGTGAEYDEFSLDHIGTGEGTQAYGWGLYFAGKREVAEWYKEEMTRIGGFAIDGERIDRTRAPQPVKHAFSLVEALLPKHPKGMSPLHSMTEADFDKAKAEALKIAEGTGLDESAEALREMEFIAPKGHLLRVDLAPAEEDYLLWDRPLSEQSEKVREALESAGIAPSSGAVELSQAPGVTERAAITMRLQDGPKWSGVAQGQPWDIGGRELYGSLSQHFRADHPGTAAQRAASQVLLSAGIRGIKYLDGTSRGKGEGSYNYVIFDPADATIQERFMPRAGLSEKRLTREIKTMSHGSETSGWIAMVDPEEYLRATAGPSNRHVEIIRQEAGPLDKARLADETQTPFLYIDENKQIVGHEGRHRMAALSEAGYTRVQVVIEERPKQRAERSPLSAHLGAQDFGSLGRGRGLVWVSEGLPATSEYRDRILEQAEDAADLRFMPRSPKPSNVKRRVKTDANRVRFENDMARALAGEQVGRPDLARTVPQELAQHQAAIDEMRKGEASHVEMGALHNIAKDMISRDFDGVERAILRKVEAGAALSEIETFAAREITIELGRRWLASGEQADLERSMVFGHAYRQSGTNASRAFTARQAKFTREFSGEELLSIAVSSPTRKAAARLRLMSRKLEKTRDPEARKRLAKRIQNIIEEEAKKSEKVRTALVREGLAPRTLTVDDWLDRGTVTKILRTISTAKADAQAKLTEWLYMAYLSHPYTHARNASGNLMSVMVSKHLQDMVEATVNLAFRNKDAPQWGEFRAFVGAIGPALSEASRRTVDAYRYEALAVDPAQLDVDRLQKEAGLYGPKIRRVMGIPGSASALRLISLDSLRAMDGLAKGWVETLAISQLAFRQAASEGHRGEALQGRMEELLYEPGAAHDTIHEAARDEALEMTFQQSFEPGTLSYGLEKFGSWMRDWLDAHGGPIPLGILTLPFRHTPIALIGQAIRRTPLVSFNMLKTAFGDRGAENKGRQWVRDISDTAIGWGAWFAVQSLLGAEDDDGVPLLQGLPSTDYKERALDYTVAPPMTIAGIPYKARDPLALALASMIQAGRSWEETKDPVGTATSAVFSLASAAKDSTYLRTLGDMSRLIEEFKKDESRVGPAAAQQLVRTYITPWVPNILRGTLRERDEELRNQTRRKFADAEGMDHLVNRFWWQMFPHASLAPPPKYDWLGRRTLRSPLDWTDPTSSNFVLWNSILAERRVETEGGRTDPDLLVWRYNEKFDRGEIEGDDAKRWFPDQPQQYYSRGGKRIYLTEDENARYLKEVGEAVHVRLRRLIEAGKLNAEDPTWRDIEIIKKVISNDSKRNRGERDKWKDRHFRSRSDG